MFYNNWQITKAFNNNIGIVLLQSFSMYNIIYACRYYLGEAYTKIGRSNYKY